MSGTYDYALSTTSQFFFCGLPFRLDMSSGCSIGCAYCFAASRGGNATGVRKVLDPDWLARKLTGARQHNSTPCDIAEEFLRRRIPVHFGGLSDPFSDEETSGLAVRALDSLAALDYPTVVSTKNVVRLLQPDVLPVLKRMRNLAIQVSFSTLDPGLASLLEPGAPSPAARLIACKLLSDTGVPMIARLQPLLPSLAAVTANETIPQLAACGFRHITIECLKVPLERTARAPMSALPSPVSRDIALFETGNRLRIGREWLLPTEQRWDILQPLIVAIHSENLTYGAADYGLLHLGDTDMCCGISTLAGFENWHKGNIAYVIRSATNGLVSFDALEMEWTAQQSARRVLNSTCRIDGPQRPIDYIRAKWNARTANAPDSYLMVTYAGERDEHGACLYYKNVVS